jgi:hypothetical protein
MIGLFALVLAVGTLWFRKVIGTYSHSCAISSLLANAFYEINAKINHRYIL